MALHPPGADVPGPSPSSAAPVASSPAAAAVASPGAVAGHDTRYFRNWLITRLSEYLQRPAEEIGSRTPFAEYGLDSVAALSLYGDIEEEFGLYLEPTVAWDHPTADELARHLRDEFAKAGDGRREV
ncbi:acyl carrier protein [Streptomyces sp. MUM 178J]|uniref:acyl carrier protein n=1 Tax=Streptomyces sp. MUM 178J TaxID=2791991 RepID=UPI003FA79012